MKKLLILAVLLFGWQGHTQAAESGILRGEDDSGTKRILKTKPDGTLLMEISDVTSIAASE